VARYDDQVDQTMPTSGNLFSFLPAALTKLEQVSGGRLGVAVLDTGTGERSGHRRTERFPMCSTFKVLKDDPETAMMARF
jgi:beta-lactamase class A